MRQNEVREEDRINYSKQIKNVQQGVEEAGRRKGRLQRLPMDSRGKQARWREADEETAGLVCR